MGLNWAPYEAFTKLPRASAHAVFIDAEVVFVSGTFGTFQTTFASDIPSTQLTGVDFDLPAGSVGAPGLGLFLHRSGAAPAQ